MLRKRKQSVKKICYLWLALAVFFSGTAMAQESRIKDLVNIRGVRSNQLIGVGLVVGLSGRGDSKASLTTNRAVASMMTKLGIQTKAEETVSGGVAAVIATAELPPFARNGESIDVQISTIGDAKSLAGGTLVLTQLKAPDGNVYAVAQGGVVIGRLVEGGPKTETLARVPQGAIIEREYVPALAHSGVLTLNLRNADFTTSIRIADTINGHFKGFFAKAKDLASVEVQVPPLYQESVTEFVAEIEALKVVADKKAVVVMNERTGTVVMGSEVSIGSVTIAHGDLSIQVGGEKGKKGGSSKAVVELGGATVGKLVETMNAMGVKPVDLVSILQAIHSAGALNADLKFL